VSRNFKILQNLLSVISAGSILIWIANKFWSGSVDTAHHYALILRFYETWGKPVQIDSSLGEMNHYPHYAHALAAMLGTIVNSPFLGMNLLVLISLILLWYSVSLVLNRQEDNQFIIHFPFIILFFFLSKRFEIHGHEIVGNYFFSQFVGQAIFFSVISIHAWIQGFDSSRYFGYFFLALSSVIIVGFHLLPSLQIIAMLTIYVVFDYFVSRARSKKQAIAGLGFVVIAILSIMVHPSFTAMREIASNNGDLWLKYTPTLFSLFVLLLSVFLLSFFGLVTEYRNLGKGSRNSAIKIVCIYGIAVSGLCGLQFLALAFGYGSEYACKKYAFSLNTALFLLVTLLVSRLISSRKLFLKYQSCIIIREFSKCLRPIYPSIVMVLAIYTVSPNYISADVKKISEIDKSIIKFNSNNALDGDIVVQSVVGSRAIDNYMFTIGSLHHPRDEDAYDILYDRYSPSTSSDSQYVVTSRKSLYDYKSCLIHELDNNLIVVDAKCAYEELSTCRSSYDFSINGNVSPVLLDGFSSPEAFGRWTDGQYASFECVYPAGLEKKLHSIRLSFATSFSPGDIMQSAKVTVNGSHATEFVIGSRPKEILLSLQDSSVKSGDNVKIEFEIPGAVSPKQLGLSEDVRKLGLGLKNIQFMKEP